MLSTVKRAIFALLILSPASYIMSAEILRPTTPALRRTSSAGLPSQDPVLATGPSSIVFEARPKSPSQRGLIPQIPDELPIEQLPDIAAEETALGTPTPAPGKPSRLSTAPGSLQISTDTRPIQLPGERTTPPGGNTPERGNTPPRGSVPAIVATAQPQKIKKPRKIRFKKNCTRCLKGVKTVTGSMCASCTEWVKQNKLLAATVVTNASDQASSAILIAQLLPKVLAGQEELSGAEQYLLWQSAFATTLNIGGVAKVMYDRCSQAWQQRPRTESRIAEKQEEERERREQEERIEEEQREQKIAHSGVQLASAKTKDIDAAAESTSPEHRIKIQERLSAAPKVSVAQSEEPAQKPGMFKRIARCCTGVKDVAASVCSSSTAWVKRNRLLAFAALYNIADQVSSGILVAQLLPKAIYGEEELSPAEKYLLAQSGLAITLNTVATGKGIYDRCSQAWLQRPRTQSHLRDDAIAEQERREKRKEMERRTLTANQELIAQLHAATGDEQRNRSATELVEMRAFAADENV